MWLIVSAIGSSLAAAAPATAENQPARPTLEQLERSIVDRAPVTRVDRVDQDRIAVRRIDVVDENGVIRLSIAAPTPQPIVDGIQYRRAFNVHGITIYDDKGSEKGGFGYAEVAGGAPVFALDHSNADAVGFRVMPDGSVMFLMNERPAQIREPGLGDRLIPGVESSSRVRLQVAANGTPSIELADGANRARVRITVTDEGYGALEFLNANGEVVQRLAPELAVQGR